MIFQKIMNDFLETNLDFCMKSCNLDNNEIDEKAFLDDKLK